MNISDIFSVQCDRTFCNIIESRNQVDHRRFTTPGTSDDRRCLSRFCCKADIMQYVFFCSRITEGYVVEYNLSFSFFQFFRRVFGSWIMSHLSVSSSTRSAATAALGSIIEIIQIIRKDMMICIVYWINAIISPTCICPSLTPCAPLHTISMLIPFMISTSSSAS